MAAMVDWITARIPCTTGGPISGGRVVCIRPDGSTEWTSDRRLSVVGSHEASISVRGGGSLLEISGNPTKWLQGHNVFGPAHPVVATYHLMRQLVPILGLTPTLEERRAWIYGEYDLTRVDINRMYDLGTNADVLIFLNGAQQIAKGRYQKASAYDGETLYLGKGSKRILQKFYNKWGEMQKPGHKLSPSMAPEWRQRLLDFAEGKLRFEVELKARELADRGLHRGSDWRGNTADLILDERVGVLELNDTVRLAEEVIEDLPPKLIPIYDAWRAGRDIRSLYSRPTFYRYRREMMAFGIDIAEPRLHVIVPTTQYLTGRPLRSFLGGPGVSAPDWARGTSLLVG